jgi:hypothetical protein
MSVMVVVYTGWSWRIARLLSVADGQAVVQFTGTDEQHTVAVEKCRRIDYVMQPSSEWRTLDGAA